MKELSTVFCYMPHSWHRRLGPFLPPPPVKLGGNHSSMLPALSPTFQSLSSNKKIFQSPLQYLMENWEIFLGGGEGGGFLATKTNCRPMNGSKLDQLLHCPSYCLKGGRRVCPGTFNSLRAPKKTPRLWFYAHMNIHTLCDELFHGDLIPSDREHFPEVAADPRAGPGPGHTSEPAALGLRHSGKLLHRFAFFSAAKCSPRSVEH